ncbi:MAG: type II toxin-antitoxin system VapC family toxin [Candidatus Sericytochromatia bacterium]|nr:type II toxin-antitoxin system VapC family toxin [Candidatus Sericytochromatia bacterium]
MRALLDTSICIYTIRQRPPEVRARFEVYQPGELAISSITLSEMEYGAAKSQKPEQNRKSLLQFLLPLEILNYDATAAQAYGKVRAELERAGTPIGAMDLMIAAHALSLNLKLITRNLKEFQRVPGLQAESWVT